MATCSKCKSRPAFSYHAYCGECRKAYRKEHHEDRSKKYKRVSPFPELCGKCHQRPHAKGHAWCSECKSEAHKEWRQKHPNWNSSTPERWKKYMVRQFASNRINRGQLLKLPCFICGELNVTAHHYLGYDKEHALDILWLCRPHHLEAERKLWCPVVPKNYSLKTPLTPKTFKERFWAKVEKTLDCWLYKGRLNHFGYGEFDVSTDRVEGAHRVSWRLANGEIPEGCIIGHLCNVRNCIRPDHLIAWPKGDDVRYMEQCGRGVHPVGESNGRAKLTENDVREIRRLYATKEMGCCRLAEKHGISPQTVYDIVNGILWPTVK